MAKRALRAYFALHEMAERRRYTEHGRTPRYTLAELASFVGGSSGGARALRRLSGDLRQLEELGLARMTEHDIAFATSADQIRVDDLEPFWAFLAQLPNRSRTVPVPRRMVRALAGGFPRSVTALVFTLLIRGLFWHKATSTYRIDGRYKLSWVSDVFGVSRRQLTEARATLIELGWIAPLDVEQWQLNKWGLHDRIDPGWAPSKAAANDHETASPPAQSDHETASPDLTDSPSLTGGVKTRRPAQTADRLGVSPCSTMGSRKKDRTGSSGGAPPNAEPNIRDIKPGDLGSVPRLLELHRQAGELGMWPQSEAGRMDFLALAERARTRGKRAGALFYWLIREHRTDFITLHDEDEAAARYRKHRDGPTIRTAPLERSARPTPPPFTDEDKFVSAVLRVASSKRIDDPLTVARSVKRGMTRDEWDTARLHFETRQLERMRAAAQTRAMGEDRTPAEAR